MRETESGRVLVSPPLALWRRHETGDREIDGLRAGAATILDIKYWREFLAECR